MGMYTELFVEGTLKSGAPQEVVDMVRFLFDRTGTAPSIDHPFFNCSRWESIGSCYSFYHIPFALSGTHVPHTGQLSFISRSDLKNYGGEIELFLNWIRPYCELLRGWHWYEEAPEPTLFNYEEH